MTFSVVETTKNHRTPSIRTPPNSPNKVLCSDSNDSMIYKASGVYLTRYDPFDIPKSRSIQEGMWVGLSNDWQVLLHEIGEEGLEV